jgi:uncharacterized iron-regulated membrane protein
MSFRKILFWCHLFIGVTAGAVILIMSLTGVLLTYQPQILRYVDRQIRIVAAPRNPSQRLSPLTLFEKAESARADLRLLGLTLQSDPREAAAFQVEGPSGPGSSPTLYVNPYTGEVLGEGPMAARSFFRVTTDWHRWLGVAGEGRAPARLITGVCNAGFLLLALSGIYLWWPRSWTVQTLKAITLFRWSADGRARDWNWHNVTGFWNSIILVVLTATAMVISFPWANDLVYRTTGSEIPGRPAAPPPSAARPGGPSTNAAGGGHLAPTGPIQDKDHPPRIPANLDRLWQCAEEQVPGWRSISFRIPPRGGAPVSFSISDGEAWDITARSRLVIDPESAEVVSFEGYSDQSLGRRVRTWMRFLHTGEALGPIGQTVAGAASAGGALLVWTGVALAFRRLLAWKRRRQVPRV